MTKNFLSSKTIIVNAIALLLSVFQLLGYDSAFILGQIPIWLPVAGIILRFVTDKKLSL